MKLLLEMDAQDYDPRLPVESKFSARALIVKDGKIAVQQDGQGECKLLGGGQEPGETLEEALAREVREEAGLLIVPGHANKIGEVVERHLDIFEKDKVYECHSFIYSCEVSDQMTEPSMTESEIENGCHLAWLSPEEIFSCNAPFVNEKSWILRDTECIRLICGLSRSNVLCGTKGGKESRTD